MAIQNDKGEMISFECFDLIKDVEEDFKEYRRQMKVYAAYRVQQGVKIIFDYCYNINDKEEMKLFPPLKDNEWFEKMSLAELYAYLIRLNNVSNEYGSISELFYATGWTIKKFSDYFEIPSRTVQAWIYDQNPCADYVKKLINYKLVKENII